MKKKATIFFMAVLAALTLSACGGSSADSGSGAGGSAPQGKGEITWSWGTFRGLYGDAEVTFNEDGGRDKILLKYPNGNPYRQIEYYYDFNGAVIGGRTGVPGGEGHEGRGRKRALFLQI